MSIKLLWSILFAEKQKKKQLKERLQYAVTQNKSDQETKKEKEI